MFSLLFLTIFGPEPYYFVFSNVGRSADSGNVLCRNLTSLSSAKESAKNELVACSSQHCASLQAATTDLLQSVTMSENAVNAFGLRVTEFCNTMQEVCPR